MMAKTTTKTAAKRTRKPKADDGPTWRRMPLSEAFDDEFDVPKGALTVLTNLGVKTCGELADRLLANHTFGLKLIEVQSLCESIEQISSDDENPVKFNDATEEPASIKCPACESDCPLVDGGEYGCSKEGCGWLGTPELAETHRKNMATKAGWMGEPAKPGEPNAAPFTPEELAAYDAETCGLTREAETAAAAAESRYLDSKERAAADKKTYEVKVLFLRKLICDRAENRGKRPKPETPTLLDVLPKWRDLTLMELRIMRPKDCTCEGENVPCETCNAEGVSEIGQALEDQGIDTLGELSDRMGPAYSDETPSLGLTREQHDSIREQIHAIIDAEFKQPAAESDLYKQFPIKRWTKFGLTKKDVEKLHACETKGTASGFPIITMGDLQRFVTPNSASPGYVQSLKDIKGIGDAGCDRIEEAQTNFWGWWRAGGEAEFAAEQKAGSEVPAEAAA